MDSLHYTSTAMNANIVPRSHMPACIFLLLFIPSQQVRLFPQLSSKVDIIHRFRMGEHSTRSPAACSIGCRPR